MNQQAIWIAKILKADLLLVTIFASVSQFYVYSPSVVYLYNKGKGPTPGTVKLREGSLQAPDSIVLFS